MRKVAVFCGSNLGVKPLYAEAARRLGRVLVANDIGLVYGGGRLGLLGALADAVIAAGGQVIGVIPAALAQLGVAHEGLSALHTVGSMHERKALMASLAGGFIALPGGLGTLEEYFEMLTWTQLDIHTKPCGLLNVDGYYEDLLRFLDRMADQGFVKPEHRAMVLVEEDPERLVTALRTFRSPRIDKVDRP